MGSSHSAHNTFLKCNCPRCIDRPGGQCARHKPEPLQWKKDCPCCNPLGEKKHPWFQDPSYLEGPFLNSGTVKVKHCPDCHETGYGPPSELCPTHAKRVHMMAMKAEEMKNRGSCGQEEIRSDWRPAVDCIPPLPHGRPVRKLERVDVGMFQVGT
jgi:hypothetical protein